MPAGLMKNADQVKAALRQYKEELVKRGKTK
jgi:hypothetical protein